jgi:threonine 3-dehydrogenase
MGASTTRMLVKARAEPDGLALETHALPPLGPTDVLLSIKRAAICGTDLHIYRWNDWAARTYRTPAPMGHEFAAEVVAVGDAVARLKPGQLVTVETHIPCGRCRQCRMNRRHTCLDMRLFSRLGRGCFGDRTVVPEAALRVVPAGIPLEHACIMEPLGISVRAVMEANVAAATVLVSGCGPVGLFAIAAARALGAARIVAADVSEVRLKIARAVGADVAVDPRSTTLTQELPDGADVAVETSGVASAIGDSLAAVRPGGQVLMLGLPDAPIPIDITRHVVLREVAVRGLYGRLIDETWLQVERLLLAKALNLAPILTHTFPLAEYDRAFALAASGEAGKVSLVP